MTKKIKQSYSIAIGIENLLDLISDVITDKLQDLDSIDEIYIDDNILYVSGQYETKVSFEEEPGAFYNELYDYKVELTTDSTEIEKLINDRVSELSFNVIRYENTDTTYLD